MSKLVELRGQLEERRNRLASIFEEAGEDYDMAQVKSLEGDSAAKAAHIKALNDEMTDLSKEIEELDGMEAIRQRADEAAKPAAHPGHQSKTKTDQQEQPKTIGQLFVESSAYRGKHSLTMGNKAELDVDFMATLFETTAGWAPADFRSPRLVDLATRPIRVVDLIPQTTTTASSISYWEETTFTNAAVEVAEGVAKPEATLALTERNDVVRKIAVWLPATEEQLDDEPRARGYVENRLGFMVRQRLDLQILVGDGTAPNISGITDRANIQTQAKGADPTPDAIYKAIQKIRVVAFSEPNGVVLHPNDWTPIRLLATADGIYLWGPPMDAGPERIWGLPVVQTTAMTENTGLVGDFRQAELAVRRGVSIEVSNSHASFFIENKLAILAEMRAALAVYRPAAFCTVTGI